MKSGIYQILNTENNKRYIGSSSNILNRWKEHSKTTNKMTKQEIKDFLLTHRGYLKYSPIKVALRLDTFAVHLVEDCMREVKQEIKVNSILIGEIGRIHKTNIPGIDVERMPLFDIPEYEQVVKDAGLNVEDVAQVWVKNDKYSIKLNTKPEEQTNFQDKFIDFLKDFTPREPKQHFDELPDFKGCLVFNKQDAHLNKLDINGDNNIEKRFKEVELSVNLVCAKASLLEPLDKIVYILGSDLFNSEWTNQTTKGTNQTNIGTFDESFKLICDHEVAVIEILLGYCQNLEVLYVHGNHDQYVGFHLVNWLKAYYRATTSITINDSMSARKYIKYGNTALQFNHGDALTHQQLVNLFPQEFKKEWSNCDYHYTFTGDKHNTKTTEIAGVRCFQIPALSKAKSAWDDKNGYTVTKAELTAFFISENQGLTTTYHEVI